MHSNDKIPVQGLLWQGEYMTCFQQITRVGTKRNCIHVSSGKRQWGLECSHLCGGRLKNLWMWVAMTYIEKTVVKQAW